MLTDIGPSSPNLLLFTGAAGVSDWALWGQDPGAIPLAGDFDGDGKDDLTLLGGDSWFTIPVAFSNGDGTFTETNHPAP